MKIINVHRIDSENIGDMVSSPFAYFSEYQSCERRDIHHYQDTDADVIVFGGGGLLHGEWEKDLARFAKHSRAKLVAWGTGLNHHDTRSLIWPKFLDSFLMIGLREFLNPWTYTPCPSCLHPAFDLFGQVEPSNHLAIYEHAANPVAIVDGWPRMNNRQTDFLSVLDFLSNAETIVTNSYHGAYWTLLLGRKVVLFAPSIDRFFGFKRALVECNESDWETMVPLAYGLPGYLEECRTLNRVFAERLSRMLDSL